MTQTISHAAVVNTIIEQQYGESLLGAKQLKSNCRAWCRALGFDFEDPAELTLGDAYPEKLREYEDQLAAERPSDNRYKRNVRSAAEKMRKAYAALLASQELPMDFTAAFRIAVDAKGLSINQLNKTIYAKYFAAERPNWYGAQLWTFYDGTGGPGTSWKGDSRLLLTRCEEVLGLKPNTLISRAYPTVKPIKLGPPKEIPFRRARSEQWAYTYGLRELPERIQTLFNAFSDWQSKDSHFVNGDLCVVEPRSLWTSPATARMHRETLLRYYGWLSMPAPIKPRSEMTEQESWQCGAGIAKHELTIAHLFDLQMVWNFIEFQRSRQHNRQITRSHMRIVTFINSFVSMPYSFLTAHPEYAAEFGLPPLSSTAEWLATVESFHQKMLTLLRKMNHLCNSKTKQRSPDEPLRHVLEDEAPYTLFLQMIDRMEQSPPLRANRKRWSVWARDMAIVGMLSEIPLRPKNCVELRLEINMTRDSETGYWKIFVPKSALKNHFSPHACDISRTFSKKTSRAMDRYVNEARCEMVGHDQSNYLLLGPAAGRRADPAFVAKTNFRWSTDSLGNSISKQLKKYFGETQGATIFRHVITTSILKDDPTKIDVAAAVLNSGPNVVAKNYKHLLQVDGLRLAQNWFNRQKGRGKPDGDEK